MTRCIDYEVMEQFTTLQEETDSLREQLRAATKKHNETVEWLDRLIALALALGRANMTRQELEKALEKLEDEALERSADAMLEANHCKK